MRQTRKKTMKKESGSVSKDALDFPLCAKSEDEARRVLVELAKQSVLELHPGHKFEAKRLTELIPDPAGGYVVNKCLICGRVGKI